MQRAGVATSTADAASTACTASSVGSWLLGAEMGLALQTMCNIGGLESVPPPSCAEETHEGSLPGPVAPAPPLAQVACPPKRTSRPDLRLRPGSWWPRCWEPYGSLQGGCGPLTTPPLWRPLLCCCYQQRQGRSPCCLTRRLGGAAGRAAVITVIISSIFVGPLVPIRGHAAARCLAGRNQYSCVACRQLLLGRGLVVLQPRLHQLIGAQRVGYGNVCLRRGLRGAVLQP